MPRTIPPVSDELLIRVLSRPRRVLGIFAAMGVVVSAALLLAKAWVLGSVFFLFALVMGCLVWRANPRLTREYRALLNTEPFIVWLLPWIASAQPLPADARARIDWSVEFEFADGSRSQPGAFRLARKDDAAFIDGLVQAEPPVEVRVVTHDGAVWVPQAQKVGSARGA